MVWNIMASTMSVNSRREEYAAQTRAAIVVSARTLFIADGYDKASIEAIAAHARVSKGAVYHHFSDKKAIFEETLLDDIRSARDVIVERMAQLAQASGQNPRSIVLSSMSATLAAFGGDEEIRTLHRQAQAVLGAERLRDIDGKESLPVITAILQNLADTGELRDVDVPMAAELLLDLVRAAITTVALAGNPETALEHADSIVSHMVSGLFAGN